MSKHTPGPWVARSLYATNDNRSAVFHTDAGKPGYSRRLDDKGTFEHADATLIAAAPDLLVALDSFMDAYDRRRNSTGTNTWEHEAMLKARAAIAKAQGVQS